MLLGMATAAAQTASQAATDSPPVLRDGGTVEYTGYPVKLDLRELGGTGILRFGVSTKDMTLDIYQESANLPQLRAIRDSLQEVIAWNGRRLLRGGDPMPVRVVGRYSARERLLTPAEIFVPKVADAAGGGETEWQRFVPSRGAAPPLPPPGAVEPLPLPEEPAPPPYYPPNVEGGPPVYSVETKSEPRRPVESYPRITYEKPNTYHIEMPKSVGSTSDSIYFSPGGGALGYRSGRGSGYLYPSDIPVHPRSSSPNPPDQGAGTGSGAASGK